MGSVAFLYLKFGLFGEYVLFSVLTIVFVAYQMFLVRREMKVRIPPDSSSTRTVEDEPEIDCPTRES